MNRCACHPDPVEVDVDARKPTPPADFSLAIDAGHVFKAKPSNDTRVKAYDCFGRWFWADGSVF